MKHSWSLRTRMEQLFIGDIREILPAKLMFAELGSAKSQWNENNLIR